MIDPMTAIAAVTAASSSISSAIKAGKDISSLGNSLSKYAKAEAELNFAANRKKNSFFSKLTGAEASGIDKFFKQEELRQEREKLREVFMLYGKMSQWTSLQAAIAEERQRFRDEIKRRAAFRDTIYQILGVIVLSIVLIGGCLGIFFFARYLKEQQA